MEGPPAARRSCARELGWRGLLLQVFQTRNQPRDERSLGGCYRSCPKRSPARMKPKIKEQFKAVNVLHQAVESLLASTPEPFGRIETQDRWADQRVGPHGASC
eukprot:scaffold15725_cov38-Prasinocladus_malaysianus.AAC.1